MSGMDKIAAAAQWEQLFEAAVLELDQRRLLSKIEEARAAILQCLQTVDPADHAQTEPLNNALQVLNDLHRISAEDGRRTDAA
jgi:hypothetical protein